MRLGMTAVLAVALAAAGQRPPAPRPASRPFPVAIHVDAGAEVGPLEPVWRFFGADEPNYATMRDGEALIGELGTLATDGVYFRAHNLLTSGDGTPSLKWGSTNAYTEKDGAPVYDWTILDRIFDTYLRHGVRPYVEIGFMPEALSSHPRPYRHSWSPTARYDAIFTGWSYPPRDYRRWRDLVQAWVAHAVDRYGREEVARWYWEVWNEPNIGYWQGSPEEFLALHDYAIDGVRRALPEARVGGPDVAGDGGQFMRDFLRHVLHEPNHATGGTGTPLDFVSFHAKGKPAVVDGHARLGIANQLETVDRGFGIIAGVPELKRTPIVIGESDPDGCAACQGPQLSYRNTPMYASYTAASLVRIMDLAARRGVRLEGVLTWAFEFEDQPLFAGFRQLATGGIDLPVLQVFRMLGRMDGMRIAATSDGAVPLDEMMASGVIDRPDVAALASRSARSVTVLVWHYHDDDVAGPPAQVALTVDGLAAAGRRVRVQRVGVDATHGNPYAAWLAMGSPAAPTADQRAALKKAAVLAPIDSPGALAVSNGACTLRFPLDRQAVSLIRLEW